MLEVEPTSQCGRVANRSGQNVLESEYFYGVNSSHKAQVCFDIVHRLLHLLNIHISTEDESCCICARRSQLIGLSDSS